MILHERRQAVLPVQRHGSVSAIAVSVACFLRGLPLFFARAPATPLRVLCMMAFDTLHVLRNSRPLPPCRLRMLAAFLDFAACANAVLDNKASRAGEFEATRQRLPDAGRGPLIDGYLTELRRLEKRRPVPGGDHRQFEAVRTYREDVVRLSLAMTAAISLNDRDCITLSRPISDDDGLETLFRIVMQCQIIDDVLDYAKDDADGLPSFLTASGSLPLSLELTAQAARDYASSRGLQRTGDLFPLRIALSGVSALAKLTLQLRRWHALITPRNRSAHETVL